MRIRTGYSFRNAVGTIKEVYDKLKEENLPLVITDRASTFGFVAWDKICRKGGNTPIFGVELGVSPNIEEKKPAIDHWTFIAKDTLTPINELVELATSQFRYEPLLRYWQALEAPVYKIIGHRTVVDDLPPNTDPDCFFGLSPSITMGQVRRFLEKGYRPIACSDNKYPSIGDRAFHEVICGRNASSQTYPQHIMGREELIDELMEKRGMSGDLVSEAFENWDKITCTATMHTGELPHLEWPSTIREQCIAGAEKFNIDLTDPVYHERLERELKLIDDKNFTDYFQIVGDAVRYARGVMVVGPARGSSSGSLVCYLLEITTIDPIPHRLIFERFIDINRDDLPDIDIDFSDQKRHLVFTYLKNKYGSDHVARLGVVSMYKPRSAINEAGGALKIPKWETEAGLDGLIERSSGDARALDTLEDTLRETPKGKKLLDQHPEILIATRMEGHPRHSGQHAAGVVLTQRPILEHIAIDDRTGCAQIDKYGAEDLDLLKIDALGLTQLSVFEDTLALAGLPQDYLEGLPLDDPAAFQVLNDGHFSGIFQFIGIALMSLTQQTKVNEFEDIVAITALARPGPLVSGGATSWINRKNGREPITYPHPVFEDYLSVTKGIVVYQEQIMEIGRNIGDLSWGDVTALRKAMSKSLGKEYFDQFGDKWKAGAIKRGVDKKAADEIWDGMCAFGSWAFNRSHSVAYGLISYWCCWLKAHHPVEFAAGSLNHESDPQRKVGMLREMAAEGIEYLAIDKDLSTDKWTVGERNGKKLLIGPLWNVKGIGPKVVSNIMEARNSGGPMPKRAETLLANPQTDIDTLYPIGDRVFEIMPDPRERNIHNEITKIGSITEEHEREIHNVLILGVAMVINPRHENETIKIAQRGFARPESEPLDSLNLQMVDDSGLIYCHIGRFKYAQLGGPVVDRGRPGKSIYAIKGKLLARSRMIMVDMIRYIGDMDPKYEEQIAAE